MWTVFFLTIAATSAKFSVIPESTLLQDQNGRVRIFHGVNAVVKREPYIPSRDSFHPIESISDEDIKYMQEWGFNFIRLGVQWEAVEKTQGVYDTEFLDKIISLINKLGEAGIYTLVDSHQDLLTRKTCGEGLPLFYTPQLNATCEDSAVSWLLKQFGYCKSLADNGIRIDEDGLPNTQDCLNGDFIFYYMMPEVNQMFEIFYNNQTIQQAYINYLDLVAQKMSGNQYVFGYDLFNEPWPGSFYKHPEYFIPKIFDHKVLQPLYQRISSTVRKSDQDSILTFQPVQPPDTFSILNGLVFSVGFTESPGGEDYHTKEMLNEHAYCCEAGADICKVGEPSLENAKGLCRKFHASKVKKRVEDAKRLGVGLMFSEFGACSDSEACFEEIRGVTEAFDESFASWTYWQYKNFHDVTTFNQNEGLFNSDGSLQVNYKLKALVRTYVQAFQGTPISMSFDAYTGNFSTSFNVKSSINLPTEIFYSSEYFYPTGLDIEVSYLGGAPEITYPTHNRVHIFFPQGIDGAPATITIKPKLNSS